MSFLDFREVANPGKKTKRWSIYSTQGGNTPLGWIQFFAPWRKYVWETTPGSIFDVKCTQEVVDFLNAHKDDRNPA